MSFGHRSSRNPWTLDQENAEPIFRRAVDLGITLWDTANVYGNGTSEEILGDAMRRFTRRDDVVLATKVGLPMHDRPTGAGLSRAAIRAQLDASLRRLKTDYVDLYQIHRFDAHTPIEETMATLHEVVTAGKVRFIGASSMAAWQFAAMQHAAESGGWTRFVSMQDQYSLVQREEEREMFGLLADQGVGSLPWCPLAKGRLARPYGMATDRSRTDLTGQQFFDDRDQPIIDTVERLAMARGVPMAQVALAWVLAQPVVAAPVVGATRAGHLNDAAAAVDLILSIEDLDALAAPYTPREPSGY